MGHSNYYLRFQDQAPLKNYIGSLKVLKPSQGTTITYIVNCWRFTAIKGSHTIPLFSSWSSATSLHKQYGVYFEPLRPAILT